MDDGIGLQIDPPSKIIQIHGKQDQEQGNGWNDSFYPNECRKERHNSHHTHREYGSKDSMVFAFFYGDGVFHGDLLIGLNMTEEHFGREVLLLFMDHQTMTLVPMGRL